MRRALLLLVALVLSFLFVASAQDLAVGNEVTFVDRFRDDGSDLQIPLHPAAGDRSVSGHLPSSSTAAPAEPPPLAHWVRAAATGGSSWIVSRYIANSPEEFT